MTDPTSPDTNPAADPAVVAHDPAIWYDGATVRSFEFPVLAEKLIAVERAMHNASYEIAKLLAEGGIKSESEDEGLIPLTAEDMKNIMLEQAEDADLEPLDIAFGLFIGFCFASEVAVRNGMSPCALLASWHTSLDQKVKTIVSQDWRAN